MARNAFLASLKATIVTADKMMREGCFNPVETQRAKMATVLPAGADHVWPDEIAQCTAELMSAIDAAAPAPAKKHGR